MRDDEGRGLWGKGCRCRRVLSGMLSFEVIKTSLLGRSLIKLSWHKSETGDILNLC